MSEIYLYVAVFVATSAAAFLAFGTIYRRAVDYPAAVKARLHELNQDAAESQDAALFKARAPLEWRTEQRRPLGAWLDRLIDQSASDVTPRSLLTACALSGGLACAAVSAFLSVWWWPVVPVAASLPILYLVRRRRIRRLRLGKQLPQAFQMLSRVVRSGQTVPAAMQTVAKAFPSPIADEFGRCCNEQNLGLSREAALRQLAERSAIMELQMFAVALLVQGRSGGDIVTMFDNLASVVRKRNSFQDRVKALTGEGRMQASVLMALPIAAFAGIYYLSPEYIATLLERPWILVAAGASQIVGALWIRRIIRIDV